MSRGPEPGEGRRTLPRRFLLCAAAAALVAAAARPPPAPVPPPVPIRPESLAWFIPPGNPHVRATWVIGSERAQGAYVLRVVLEAGGRIAVHTHPDERIVTVLAGTLSVGFGTDADASARVAMPAGTVYVVPAGVPHFLAAPDGDVTYQEAGVGPTATVPLRDPQR